MMNQAMNREDKIRFLQDLQKGKRNIESLSEQEHSIWCQRVANGMYEGSIDGAKVFITEPEFQAYCAKHPKQNIIVLKPAPGCEPIAEEASE